MRFAPVSLAVLATALATPAFAQDAGTEDQGGIREIVVTAQKRAEDVQDVPIAISAFDATSLQERAVGSVAALSGITPNVTLDASTPFSGSSAVLGATIRGIGSSDFAFNIDPAVGVYLDGVYLGRSIGANQDLLDVERIEVLKGPQGTLFGRNSVGGAISIVTKNPGDKFRVTGDVTVGSFERMQVRGMVELPITDGLSSSLAFSMLNRQGYQKRVDYPGEVGDYDSWELFPASGYQSGSRQGGDDTWSLRGKLHWDNGSNFRATLSGDFTKVDQDSTANTVLAVTPISGPFAGLAENNIPGTALDVVTGNSGFLFAGLYNFCIGATPDEIAARNAQNVCGPRSSVEGYLTLPALASRNVDADPLNDVAPYDDRWVSQDIDESYATGNNFSKLNQGGIGLDLELDLSDNIMLKSISSWRKLDFAAGVDLDNSPLPILQTSFSVNQEQWSQELQLTGSAMDGNLNFVLGGYVFNEKGDLRDYVTFAGGLLQVDGPGKVDTTAYAGFGQIDWRVSDLIGFTLGGRWTREDKSYVGSQSDINGHNYKLFNCMDLTPQGIPTPECATAVGFPIPDEPFRYYPLAPKDQTFENFSFKAGAQVYPTDDVMLYGSFSQGYKTGGWTTRLSNPLPTAPTFGEEKAETWEVGVKSTLIDRRLQLNAAAFSTEYNGIQLNFQEGVSPTVQNAGDARIKGFEVEAVAAPTDNFQITASIGYLDAYYTDVAGPAQVAANPFQLGVFAGADLPKAPDWKINISPRLELPVGNGSLVLLGDWTHTTSMRNDTEGTILLMRPATDIVNASATYRPDDANWDITVGATNLTDERYLVTGQAQIAGGVIYGTYSRPREWYVRVGFDF
ncbi:TonB-dependent receptor [Erythrobacter sp. SG61-1L]|uniref:TonB-dependent receptor n=1 Tax=Erythrobacter sp. SG61-1L TaxID=1603897 RepID=UPI0006C904A7|nr:TonB-dependent receptor [Erythrobacter sp. SG61-1L]KPL69529.1 TonB-dependent receptor [Erythrobacter sp. SG61-1L]